MATKGEITTTEPLRTAEEIQMMLDKMGQGRDRLWFLLGINSALRVSDLVKIKVSDFDFTKDVLQVREQKTKKIKTTQLNHKLSQLFKHYLEGRKGDEWVFRSRQKKTHLSTNRVREIIRDAGEACGLRHISTHTMRKTFGYQAWKAGKPFPLIMAAFNHVDPKVTMRYLCIEQDEVNNMTKTMELGF